MGGQYFVEQIATTKILKQVTTVCAECYSGVMIDDKIYYDMERYRYICKDCYKGIIKSIESKREIIEESAGLFA
jgi:hypothetical protein